MSLVKIQGNASGTGVFTVASPNSNTDRTLTLPDSAGVILNNQSDITAQVKTATSASGSAPIYSCRAWVNFNGAGTVAIRGSGNVSSITDNGTGDYTVNFTTAMPDANYSAVHPTTLLEGTGITYTVANYARTPNNQAAPTTTAYRFSATNAAAIPQDLAFCYVAIFR